MALLILREVDNTRTFLRHGAQGLSAAPVVFTRGLLLRMAQDLQLAWLESRDPCWPLTAGLTPNRH